MTGHQAEKSEVATIAKLWRPPRFPEWRDRVSLYYDAVMVIPLPTQGGYNYLIHGLAGVFVPWLFPWTLAGIAASVGFAALIQAIDTARMYRFEKGRILEAPDGIRQQLIRECSERMMLKYAQVYMAKVLWYALVTLIVAYVARELQLVFSW